MKPTDLPKRNVQLLQDTMKRIEDNPALHDQTVWVNECGTAFCYAGHAAVLAGAEVPQGDIMGFGRWWCVDPVTLKSTGVHTSELTAKHVQVDAFAATRLGITYGEADVLFDANRTIPELRALVDALCTGAWITSDECIYVDGEPLGYVDAWLEDVCS